MKTSSQVYFIGNPFNHGLISLETNRVSKISGTTANEWYTKCRKTVEVSKLLGVNIDCCLAWSNHLEILANKISKKLGVLKRLKPFMSGDALLKVYNCIICPHFNYCSTVWSAAKNSSNIDRLLKLQKRAARIILNV